MKVKEESENIDLKLNIQKTKFMSSGPITSWKIDGETLETMTQTLFADGDCSHEIKRRLLLERRAVTNLDKCIKKQRHHFADNGLYSQRYGFSSSNVWM